MQSHGPNNDGCDPESCENVLIEDCDFDTGDIMSDGCTKVGTTQMGDLVAERIH